MSDCPFIKGVIAPDQQRQRVIDGSCSETILDWFALFHLWDFITAEATEGKPEWRTISQFPLNPETLYQRWKSSAELVGVRFKSGKEGTTSYALIDVDIGSQYHPQQNSFAVQAIIGALEEIGICRHIKVRSSASGGLHLYLPLPQRFNCYKLAMVLQQVLERHEFQIKSGQLEIFPNVKTPRSNYMAHRLPLQIGSFVLDDEFQPLHNSIKQLTQTWSTSAESQDLARLTEIISSTKWHQPSRSRDLGEWQQRLETSFSQGFTRKGQTNDLVKESCIYLRVFKGLSWDEIETSAHAMIVALPGYQKYCGHQREIKKRIQEWVKTNRKSNRYYPAHSFPKATKIPKAPSNEARSLDALKRIQEAIVYLVESETLPDAVKERQNRIREVAKCGTKTLWKYKELWHPHFQVQGCVTKDLLIVSGTPETFDNEHNPLIDKQLRCVTRDKSMVSMDFEEIPVIASISGTQ